MRSAAARLLILLVWSAAASLLASGRASAQRVERVGEGDVALDRRLDRLLRAADFLLVTRDTTLTPADTVGRSVLVLEATVAIEGMIQGDLISVDANVFLRPGSLVFGDVVNVGGGLYRSELARVARSVIDLPLAEYRVAPADGGFRIEALVSGAALKLDGFLGFHAPTYDRIDAVSLIWGAAYSFPAIGGWRPTLAGRIGYRSGRGAGTGGVELRLASRAAQGAVGAEKITATNDAWIRGDLQNTGSYLLSGKDYRNYYQAERVYFRLGRQLRRSPAHLALWLGGQIEDARSLAAEDRWTLFEDEVRANPPVREGRVASLSLELAGGWTGSRSAVEAAGTIEAARRAAGGELPFERFLVRGEWAMQALWNHRLELDWRFQGPLPGSDSLPHQRWSIVGGSGTLNTFEIGEFAGDRLAFVETTYIVPLPQPLRLPLLGAPELHFLHAIGMAWSREARRDLEQNLGLRLQFLGVYLRLLTNPADPGGELKFDLGISWPFQPTPPWEQGR
ncbi:MAG: hypothetical protein HY703_08255 [Gemmatimonadetes bacterium]|nr:hypothetical protein [Gemmatimonadota bacterium]